MDITREFQNYYDCLKEVWENYYLDSPDENCEGELFSSFKSTSLYLFYDLVLYRIQTIDRRDYHPSSIGSYNRYFRSLKITFDLRDDWREDAFFYDDNYDLIEPDSLCKYISKEMFFLGFRGLGSSPLEYIEVSGLNSEKPSLVFNYSKLKCVHWTVQS